MLNPFKRSYTSNELTLLRFLGKIPLFEGLEQAELYPILPHMYLRTYRYREAIFFRNDPSQALYLVRQGKVSLNLDLQNKFEEISRLGPFQAFGDNSLLPGARRIYSALSLSDECELYVLPGVHLQELFEDNPQLKAQVMENLAQNYNDSLARLFRAYQSSFGFFEISQAFVDAPEF